MKVHIISFPLLCLSPKRKYVISGSEDHFIYLWKTQYKFYKFSSALRDRNDYYEAVKGIVTVV